MSHGVSQKGARALWRDVVAATPEPAQWPARVLLHVLLNESAARRRSRRLRSLYWLVRRFTFRPRPLRPIPSGHPCFLFAHSTPSNLGNIVPVYRAAKAVWPSATVLLGERVTQPNAITPTDHVVSFTELIASTSIRERRAAFNKAASAVKATLRNFDGTDPAYASVIRSQLWYVYAETATAALAAIGTRHLLGVGRPTLLVSTSDLWPVEHEIYSECNRTGVPTYEVQHGLPYHCWNPSPAGRIFVWGQSFHDQLIQFGCSPMRLQVCGMPASDAVFSNRAASRGLDVLGQVTALLLSHTHSRFSLPELCRSYGRLVRELVLGHSTVRWVVKLHPNETDEFYRGLGADVFSRLIVLPKTTALQEAIRDCSFACTLFSASGLEAMIMERPLVVLNLGPEVMESAWWPTQGGGLYVDGAAAMSAFLDQFATHPEYANALLRRQREFLSHAFANHGGAAEAIVAHMVADTAVAA